MIAAGFSVFSACLLGCFVGLSASQDVYCLKNNTRLTLNASSSDKCHSQTYLCQAITDGGLYLECVNCDQLQNTSWTIDPTPDKGLEAILKINTPTNTLYLPGNVTPGCYHCKCGNMFASIEVTVNKSDLRFTYNGSLPYDHIMLQPEGGTLDITDTGKVNISCPATAYPDPRYEWTYSEGPEMPPIFHPISNDPCLDVSPDGQYLVFSVSPLNSGEKNKRTYQCIVSNGVSKNITSRKNNVEVHATNWILHTHPLQTVGTILLLDGVGNGTVAAYNDWWDDDSQLSISYEICRIPDYLNLTAASMPSCLYKQLKCCSCDSDSSADNCPFNLTSHGDDEAVDPAGMYEPTVACYFQVREQMDIAMFATRCYYGDTCEDRVRQLMGISEVRTSVSPPLTTPSDTNVYIAAGVGSGGILMGILVVMLCSVGVIVVYKKLNPGVHYQHLDGDEGVPRGEDVPRGSQSSTSGPSLTQEASIPVVMVSEITEENEDHPPRSKPQYSPSQEFDEITVEMSFLMIFVTKMAAHWYTIGNSFNDPVPSQTNNNIAQIHCVCEEKMARVLWAWISSGQEVRWSKLLTILSNVGLVDIAMEMETALHERHSAPATTTASNPSIYDRLEVTTTMAADYIPHICTHWYLIANILGGAAAVEANGNLQDSSKDASVKMTQILQGWINSGEDVHWSRLVKALRIVGMGATADQLEEKLRRSLAQSQSDDKSASVEELPFGHVESVTTETPDSHS